MMIPQPGTGCPRLSSRRGRRDTSALGAVASRGPAAPLHRPVDGQPHTSIQGPTTCGDLDQHRAVEQLERLWSEGGANVWESSSVRQAGGVHHPPAVDVHQATVWRISTPPTERPQRTRNQERSPDYFANVGDAIRVLREDIPLLFSKDLDYRIYRDDIVFKDPRNTFEGMKNYKLIFWSLRFHGKIFFSKLYVEVKRIWQPSDDVIKMRWTVHGIPRVPWEAQGLFDGISTYKLDHEGKVYEHSVDNVLLRDPPMLTNPPLLAGLNLVPGGQAPCPGACVGAPLAAAAAEAVDTSLPQQPGSSEMARNVLLPPLTSLNPQLGGSFVAGAHPEGSGPGLVAALPVVALPVSPAALQLPAIIPRVPSARAAAEAQLQGLLASSAGQVQGVQDVGTLNAHHHSHQHLSPGMVSLLGAPITQHTAGVWQAPQRHLQLQPLHQQQQQEEHHPSQGPAAAAPLQSTAATALSAPSATAEGQVAWGRFSWVRLYAAWWGSVSLLAALQGLVVQLAGGSMEPSPSRG